MKLALKRLLIFLVVLTMVIPTGLAYAATEDGTAASGDEAVTVDPEEGGNSDITDIDPGTLNVHRVGDDLDLDAIKAGIAKTGKSGVIDPEEIEKMSYKELNQKVRVSIFLEDPAVLDKYTVKQSNNFKARAYRARLEANQQKVESKINSAIGKTLDVKWRLTLAVNVISAEATYAEIAEIYKIKGVERIEREKRYEALTDVNAAEPNTSISSEGMTGAYQVWGEGYTGAGTRIAIIDTGCDTSHQSFDEESFDHAIGLLEESGQKVDLLTEAGLPDADNLNGQGIYVSSKIPYAYNYVDQNTDVTHENDKEGEHGSHVSGIAAANRFVKVDGEFVDAADNVFAVGMAPDAQLIEMKVFGKKGGAYDSDYMAAIEDAIVLECDSCNLSLGSSEPGFTFDTYYQDVLNKLSQSNDGMVVSVSAGNSGAWAENNSYFEKPFADDINFDTVGSPASFVNSLSVASAQNLGMTGKPLVFDETVKSYYTESSNSGGAMGDISRDGGYDYVYINSVGRDVEYAAVDSVVDLEGKIVIVNRGVNMFVEKGNNLIPYAPAGLVIANNQSGTISMALDEYTGTFPMVSILLSDANEIKKIAAESDPITISGAIDDEGKEIPAYDIVYYTGKVDVTKDVSVDITNTLEYTEISDFSSFGIPGSLIMKPEITAPGGNIYSVAGYHITQAGDPAGGPDQYELMSGTSMAAPHIAGLSALLLQYLKDIDISEFNSELGDYTNREIAQSLLMSTADPMNPYSEDGYNGYLSVLQQGAGLADVQKAKNAGSVIMMNDAGLATITGASNDGKIKVELGDDPGKEGNYSYSFTVYNTKDVAEEFELRTDMFTQDIDGTYSDIGIDLLSPYTRDISSYASYSWVSDFETEKHDVDMDGDTDRDDAQAILDFITGEIADSDAAELDLEAGDMDGDGKLTSKDAEILLNWKPEGYKSNYIVPANGKAEVTVNISITDDLSDYVNGAYIEGFTYLDCVTETPEGEDISHTHSIPILGFYGNWTDATMFDKVSYNDVLYDIAAEGMDISELSEEEIYYWFGPYTYSDNYYTNFLTVKGSEEENVFAGNPYKIEADGFPYGRLAVRSDTLIKDFYYTLIRPAGTVGYAFTALDENDEPAGTIKSKITEYSNEGVWYYEVDEKQQNTRPKVSNVNVTPKSLGLKEDDKFRAGLYAVPEYEAMLLNYALDGSATSAYSGLLSFDEYLGVLVGSGLLGDGSYVGYDLTVDDTAPVIDKESTVLDEESKTITLKASDNQNIAYVAMLSVDGEKIYYEEIPAGPEANITIDASEAIETAEGFVALFAGDYAGNEAAVAIRVNDADAPDPTLVSEVRITPERLGLFINDSAELGAEVFPITASDRSVAWSSEDDTIATVDENGTVTGLKEGTTIIKATSNQDPEIYAECEVNVVYIEKELNAVVWDEEGQEWFSHFNTGKLPEYNKDASTEISNTVTAFNYYGNIIAGTLDTSTATSSIYIVDPENEYASEPIGDMYTWASDIALGFEIYGTPLAYINGPNLVMGNLEYNPNYEACGVPYVVGSFDSIGTLAGIAFKDTGKLPLPEELIDLYKYYYEDEYDMYFAEDKYDAPSYYLLGTDGKVWEVQAILEAEDDGEGSYVDVVSFSEPVLVADTGVSTDFLYQSLYYDGEYVYWSHFDGGDYALLYIIDPETGDVFKAGDFGNAVWPASGLYEMDAMSGVKVEGNSAPAVDRAELSGNKVEANIEILEKDADELDSMLKYALSKYPDKKALAKAETPEEETVPYEEAEETALPAVVEENADETEAAAEEAVSEAPQDEDVQAEEAETDEGVIQEEEPSGTLNAVRGYRTVREAEVPDALAEDEDAQGDTGETEEETVPAGNGVEVLISEDIASTNGYVTVKYDPEKIAFNGASSDLQYNSIHVDEETGTINFAYADVSPIDAGTVLAAIKFCVPCEDAALTLTTKERNEELDLNEESATPTYEGVGHTWDEGVVTKPATTRGDGIMTYTCEVCGHTREEVIIKYGWKRDENGDWNYINDDATKATGWKKVDGKWYYMDESGVMQTGWQKINGKWYYFNKNGAMQTGWQKIDGKWYYFSASGVMQKGWQKIDGKDYYFKASGAMAANEWVTGYWWLSAGGAWTYKYRGSWEKTSDGHWMFKASSGWTAKNTTIVIDGVSYTFDANGWRK